MAKKEQEEDRLLYYLGWGVAISTLLLNVVQIIHLSKDKENKPNTNNNQI